MKTFLIALFLFVICLVRLDRIFFKHNKGFCLHHIYAQLQDGKTEPFPEEILDQKFFYLTKGNQTFVFLSQDQKYVLKLYRFPRTYRKFSLSSSEYNNCKVERTFQSFEIAAEELKNETALIAVHLKCTQTIKKKVCIVDLCGIHYNLDLDSLAFLIQKKAEPIFNREPQQIVREIIRLSQMRAEKSIADLDAVLEKNFGWLEDKLIHIDVGNFVKKPVCVKEDVLKITDCLKECPHYQEIVRDL